MSLDTEVLGGGQTRAYPTTTHFVCVCSPRLRCAFVTYKIT